MSIGRGGGHEAIHPLDRVAHQRLTTIFSFVFLLCKMAPNAPQARLPVIPCLAKKKKKNSGPHPPRRERKKPVPTCAYVGLQPKTLTMPMIIRHCQACHVAAVIGPLDWLALSRIFPGEEGGAFLALRCAGSLAPRPLGIAGSLSPPSQRDVSRGNG